MQELGNVLGGLGVLGMIAMILVGSCLLMVIPLWCIVDCARSERDDATKAVIIILIFLSCSLASVIYGMFFAASKVLRRFTAVSFAGLVLLTALSFSSCVGSAKISSDITRGKNAKEEEQLIAAFNPGTVDVASIGPFKAIHFVHQAAFPSAASVAEFSIAGPAEATAFSIPSDVRHVVHDHKNNRYYAVTQHAFGTIDPATGTFETIEVEPGMKREFCWLKGLAFDAEQDEVIILASHVDTKWFVYNTATRAWTKTAAGNIRQSLIAMAYSPDDKLMYALEGNHGRAAISALHKFSRLGADLGTMPVVPPIPIVRGQNEYFQMTCSSGKIILVIPPVPAAKQPGFGTTRMCVVDPRDGNVSVAQP